MINIPDTIYLEAQLSGFSTEQLMQEVERRLREDAQEQLKDECPDDLHVTYGWCDNCGYISARVEL